MDTPNQTLLIQWNLNGFRGKLPELQLLISQYSPIVLALQETLLKGNNLPDHVLGNKYNWYLKPDRQHPGKNGVAVGVRNGTPHTMATLNYNDTQVVAVSISVPIKITIASIYWPPTDSTYQSEKRRVKELEDIMNDLPKPCIIAGDLNAHNPLWGSYKTTPRGQLLQNAIISNRWKLLNSGEPTRINPRTGLCSAIDITLGSADLSDNFSWTTVQDNHGSDHIPIRVVTNSPYRATQYRGKWITNKANWEKFGNEIKNLLKQSTAITYKSLTKCILKAAEKAIPYHSGYEFKRQVPWWSGEIKEVINKRRRTMRAFKRGTNNSPVRDERRREYIVARNKARAVIKRAKQKSWNAFLEGISTKTPPEQLWGKLRACSGNTNRSKIVLRADGQLTDDPNTIVNCFGEHFYEMSANEIYPREFIELKREAETTYLPVIPDDSAYYNNEFSMNELIWALTKAKGKAPGMDNIPYVLLRNLPLEGLTALLEVYNNIWIAGNIPKEWKEGLVIPIPKLNQDTTNVNNYRPITLLPCMAKTLERMVNRRLVYELETRKLLSQGQHAFRNNKSTETYLNELSAQIDTALRGNKHTDLLSLDLTKAYNRMWRQPIMERLEKWGFGGRVLRYITDYLTGTTFKVGYAGAISSSKMLVNGTPQGSVISPTLFLIALEPLFELKLPQEIKVLAYADDIALVSSDQHAGTNRRKMQKGANMVQAWATSVGFDTAPSKSKIMHFCSKRHYRKVRELKLRGVPVPVARKLKLIGVTMDPKLRFNEHIKELRNSCGMYIRLLKIVGGRFRPSCRGTLLKVLNNTIVAKAQHGMEMYSRGGEKILRKFEPTYNEGVRQCTGAFRSSPISSLMAEAGQLPWLHKAVEIMSRKAARLAAKIEVRKRKDYPFLKQTQSMFRKLTGSTFPKVEFLRAAMPEWENRSAHVDEFIKRRVRAGCPEKQALAVFNSHKETQSGKLLIYTDGSKTDDSVGFGVICENGKEIVGALPTACSIFSAEAYAIRTALRELSRDQAAVIYTDSAAVVEAVKKGNSDHPWINDVVQNIRNSRVKLCWIPGHCGISGNERADKLANEGRRKTTVTKYTPAADAAHGAKKRIRENWEAVWRRSATEKLRQIKETSFPWRDNKNQINQRVLSRLRIGHTWATHSPIVAGQRRPPRCDTCQVPLTVEHILTECNETKPARQKHNIKGTLKEILKNDKEEEAKVINFLRETDLINKI